MNKYLKKDEFIRLIKPQWTSFGIHFIVLDPSYGNRFEENDWPVYFAKQNDKFLLLFDIEDWGPVDINEYGKLWVCYTLDE